MIFKETALQDAYVVDIDPVEDSRGFFARTWCRREFQVLGLNPEAVQCNLSFNHIRGTIRGMHYQAAPHSEIKLVKCLRGAIYDVIIDLRPKSPSFRAWLGIELNENNRRMLYVPEGFAHGYQTIEDNSEVFYLVSNFYHPESERGIRWNDPAFKIEWPLKASLVSPKDSSHPDYRI